MILCPLCALEAVSGAEIGNGALHNPCHKGKQARSVKKKKRAEPSICYSSTEREREREHGDNQGWVLITLDGIQIVYTKTDLLLLRVFRGPWLQHITAPFMPTVSPSRSSPTPGSVPLDLNLPEIFGRLDSQVPVKCSLQPFMVPVTVFALL